MTTLRLIELSCPVCGKSFQSQAVASTNAFGGKRTDFHERAAGTQPLAYQIHTCDGYGFPESSAGSEQPVPGITESGEDISVRVELPVECRAVDLNIRM